MDFPERFEGSFKKPITSEFLAEEFRSLVLSGSCEGDPKTSPNVKGVMYYAGFLAKTLICKKPFVHTIKSNKKTHSLGCKYDSMGLFLKDLRTHTNN